MMSKDNIVIDPHGKIGVCLWGGAVGDLTETPIMQQDLSPVPVACPYPPNRPDPDVSVGDVTLTNPDDLGPCIWEWQTITSNGTYYGGRLELTPGMYWALSLERSASPNPANNWNGDYRKPYGLSPIGFYVLETANSGSPPPAVLVYGN